MGQKLGVKETVEALDALLELSVVMATLLKDGVQIKDVGILIDLCCKDSKFKEKLEAAMTGASAIPAEMRAIDLSDMTEIVGITFSFIPRLLEALLKKQA